MSGRDARGMMEENRAHWDELAVINPQTEFYDVESFKAGRTHLDSVVREQLGDVSGKSVLHLQCHFGMDTIRLSRLGADATGADFSSTAIALARSLADELGQPTRFVESNVYDLPGVLDEQFDIVFTSHGVLGWLPDIVAWGAVVAHFLKPGGRFVIVEAHPAAWPLDDESPDALAIRYPYFSDGTPLVIDLDRSYADPDTVVTNKRTHNWNHPLSNVVNALISAGLAIEHLGEYPMCAWPYVPLMRQDDDGWWRLPAEYPQLPFLFSLRATKLSVHGIL